MIKKAFSKILRVKDIFVNMLAGNLITNDELSLILESMQKDIAVGNASIVSELRREVNEQSHRYESRLMFFQDLISQLAFLVRPNFDDFEQSLRYELVVSLLNEFIDNYDPKCGANTEDIESEINNAISYYRLHFDKKIEDLLIDLPISDLDCFYCALSDSDSKSLLVKLIAYRLLGLTKVRLRSSVELESDMSFYSKLQYNICSDKPIYKSGDFEVKCYDLNFIGLNYRCYSVPFAINAEYKNNQYSNDLVRVCPGDFVLDCGACWGDTSLWFASQVGSEGRVFSFEFIPSNLEILHANLLLNPNLSERVQIVQNPLSVKSGDIIRCADNGAASTFKILQQNEEEIGIVEAVTVSIDDWVESRNIKKIDFIKMDIEGAELDALLGAARTLRCFRPRLAIALYHNREDLYTIPSFLESLNLGYSFYLKHPTAAGFETVLLAISEAN